MFGLPAIKEISMYWVMKLKGRGLALVSTAFWLTMFLAGDILARDMDLHRLERKTHTRTDSVVLGEGMDFRYGMGVSGLSSISRPMILSYTSGKTEYGVSVLTWFLAANLHVAHQIVDWQGYTAKISVRGLKYWSYYQMNGVQYALGGDLSVAKNIHSDMLVGASMGWDYSNRDGNAAGRYAAKMGNKYTSQHLLRSFKDSFFPYMELEMAYQIAHRVKIAVGINAFRQTQMSDLVYDLLNAVAFNNQNPGGQVSSAKNSDSQKPADSSVAQEINRQAAAGFTLGSGISFFLDDWFFESTKLGFNYQFQRRDYQLLIGIDF